MKTMFTILVAIMIMMTTTSIATERVITNTKFEKLKVKILICESNLRHHNVWGDHHKAYGIAQFHLKTFNYFKKLADRPKLKWKSYIDQLWLFDWALKNGHGNDWTCYRKCSV